MALKRMVSVCISLHMELLGTDIQYIQASLPNYGYLALLTVKRIMRDVLLAIAYAHSRGIAHTGLLLGLLVPVYMHIFFGVCWITNRITLWLPLVTPTSRRLSQTGWKPTPHALIRPAVA